MKCRSNINKRFNALFWLWVLLLSLWIIPAKAAEIVLVAQVDRGVIPQTQLNNGWLPRRIVFSYQGISYTAHLEINSEAYNSLDNAMQRHPLPNDLTGRVKLVENGVEAVRPLAYALRKAAPAANAEILVAFVLAFVQSLPYKLDALTTPYDDAWRAPLQTLVDEEIDCEDSAILYTSRTYARTILSDGFLSC